MNIAFTVFKFINKLFPAKDAYAHCDIPCGIYIAQPAQTAAETVEKMVQKIQELEPPQFGKESAEAMKSKANSMMRYVMVKEQHAELCKRELLILWTDYFKDEHIKMFPDLHEKILKATKLCSQNKREVNTEAAQELRKAVGEIADIFNRTKQV